MGMKDLAHKLRVETVIAPLSCAQKAAWDTAYGATPTDTLGCESVTFILGMKGGSCNGVFTVAGSDTTIAADAGTALTSSADVQIHRDDGTDATGITIGATQILTYAANAGADAHSVVIQVTSPYRYVRINCTSMTSTTVVSLVCIKSFMNRQPYVA